MQVRTAASHDARRQIGRHRPPVRRRPALAQIERHLGFEHNVLNDDLFVALVARTRRRRGRQRHRPVDAQLRHAGTATARRRRLRRARLLRRRTVSRLLHARRLHRRSRRQALQTPDLVLQRLDLELRRSQRRLQLLALFTTPIDLADQSANQSDQFGRTHILKQIVRAGRHPRLEIKPLLTLRYRPGICPGYDFCGPAIRPEAGDERRWHANSLIPSLSKDDPVGGEVRAPWNVLRQAQDEARRWLCEFRAAIGWLQVRFEPFQGVAAIFAGRQFGRRRVTSGVGMPIPSS